MRNCEMEHLMLIFENIAEHVVYVVYSFTILFLYVYINLKNTSHSFNLITHDRLIENEPL